MRRSSPVCIRHVLGLYDVIDRLWASHPDVAFASCSGGEGRVDLGIMPRTEQVWTSDNTDAYDRLCIQGGFTFAYTPGAMMSWVTHRPTWANGRHLSLDFRFHGSMAGGLGIGDDIRKWTAEEMSRAAELIAEYKGIRPLIPGGDLYRINSPRQRGYDGRRLRGRGPLRGGAVGLPAPDRTTAPVPPRRRLGASARARPRGALPCAGGEGPPL